MEWMLSVNMSRVPSKGQLGVWVLGWEANIYQCIPWECGRFVTYINTGSERGQVMMEHSAKKTFLTLEKYFKAFSPVVAKDQCKLGCVRINQNPCLKIQICGTGQGTQQDKHLLCSRGVLSLIPRSWNPSPG